MMTKPAKRVRCAVYTRVSTDRWPNYTNLMQGPMIICEYTSGPGRTRIIAQKHRDVEKLERKSPEQAASEPGVPVSLASAPGGTGGQRLSGHRPGRSRSTSTPHTGQRQVFLLVIGNPR
jgi:hypothetical protein